MKLDIKTIITLLTFTAAACGFYYTTQSRLDILEVKVVTISKQIKQIKKNSKGVPK